MKKELKHYLGIILLINLLSSCKDEFMQGYRDVNMLHFDVSLIRPETSKGIPINSASDTAFTDFGIFVYETSDEFNLEAVPSAFSDDNFNNKEVYKLGTDKWVFDQTYYWPESGYLSFFAYAPYTTSSTNGIELVYSDNQIPSIKYTVPSIAAVQPDLMVAVPKLNLFKETVDIKFAHALACVGFNVRADSVLVDSVWITGISTTGTLDLNFNGTEPSWSDIGAADTSIYTFGIVTDAIADTSASNIMAIDGYLMMIPQTLSSDAFLMIRFGNMDIKKIALSSTSITEWEAGYKYIYSLKEGDYDFTVSADAVDCLYTGGTFNFNITSTYTPYDKTSEDIGWTVYLDTDSIASDTTWLNGFSSLGGDGGKDLSRTITVGVAPYDISVAAADDKTLYDASYSTMTDLSLYNNSAYSTNFINTYSSANCYIVNGPGYYKFPCWLMGNSLLRASASDGSVAVNNNNCYPWNQDKYVNYKGIDITQISDLEIDVTGASAKLIWQDAPELVSDVTITDDNKYISFYVAKETIRQGNAIIAILDSDNIVMWSWHIWVRAARLNIPSTSFDLYMSNMALGRCSEGGYEYEKRQAKLVFKQNNSNKTVDFLITQLADTITVNYNALYYQWGRKDPMLSSNGMGENKNCYGDYPFSIASATGSVAMNVPIQNPNIFYPSDNSWLNNEEINLWHIRRDEKDYKSIYDPSPIGYMVPARQNLTSVNMGKGWTTTGGFGEFYFTYERSSTDTTTLTLLAHGSRVGATGKITGDNSNGNYWTATYQNSQESYSIFFNNVSTGDFFGPQEAANGYCVVPMRDYTD